MMPSVVRVALIGVVRVPVPASQEGVGVVLQLLPDRGMIAQEIPEARVIAEIAAAVHQRGVAAEIVGDFGMFAHEAIEALDLVTGDLAVATLLALDAMRAPEHGVRVFAQLAANARMVVEKFAQAAVLVEIAVVVRQGGITLQIARDPGMIAEELVEAVDRVVVVGERRSGDADADQHDRRRRDEQRRAPQPGVTPASESRVHAISFRLLVVG
jgi:hypothetical protein